MRNEKIPSEFDGLKLEVAIATPWKFLKESLIFNGMVNIKKDILLYELFTNQKCLRRFTISVAMEKWEKKMTMDSFTPRMSRRSLMIYIL